MLDITYSIAAAQDYDDIIEHANFVFSYAHCPHEFKTLVPKAYGPDRSMWPNHFIARENGRIRGLVGLLEFNQRVLDVKLHMGFIGTVSVHQYSRGRGHMKKCMAMSTEYALSHGIDLLALGGQRQRYGYYGYEKGGAQYEFEVSATNCRHALGDVEIDGISFEPFRNMGGQLAELHAIYEAAPVAGARPVGSFFQICGTWRNEPYAVLEGGRVMGYIIASGDKRSINEIRLKADSRLYAVVKAYITHFGVSSVHIAMAPYMKEYVRALSKLSEACRLSDNEMFMICNYEHVVSAGLKLKQYISGRLPDGRVALGIRGIAGCAAAKVLEIGVSAGDISCHFTDATPDITLDTLAAQNLLLSNFPYTDMAALPPCARSYFPLPLHIESADGF